MLLPETNRSSVPFVVSLTVQSSLVLLLAIPWTVQTIGSTFFHSMIKLQLPKPLAPPEPVEPAKTADTKDATNSLLPRAVKQIRVFQPPLAPSRSLNSNLLPSAPDVAFDPGMPFGPGTAAHVTDLPFRSALILSAPPDVPVSADPQEQVVVGGQVQAAKLIHRVQPVYPPLARQVRVQGVVTLEAIIATDGSIQQLRVLRGHPLLIQSAVQAVRQWIYSPTILNGKAVEVKTTIDVRFTLLQ